MKMNVKPLLVLPIALTFVLCLMAFVPSGSSEPLTDTGVIDFGYSKNILVGSWAESGDIHFKVTTNASVDVYVMTSTTYTYYPESFSPTYAVEKRSNADFKVHATANEAYYLVIDNQDNSRSTDQVPTGSVTYTAEYPNVLDRMTDTVNTAITMCMLAVILVVVIVVVVIIVIVYFVTRKKTPPPTAVAPPVAYQQPAYAQPPPQYAPPPPSPYEPPPPPPPGQQYPPPQR